MTILIQDPVETPRGRMLRDINAAAATYRPSLWDVTGPQSKLNLSWEFEELRQPLLFSRFVFGSYNGGYTVVEQWEFHPDDLNLVGCFWGHPYELKWDEILTQIPEGRVAVRPRDGKIAVYRDFTDLDIGKLPPYPLNLLPTIQNPGLPYNEGLDLADLPTGNPSELATFWEDLVAEELQDRDGVPIRISKTWDFEENFSRFSPQIRMERRVRLNFTGAYSVFDLYRVRATFLLGDIHETDPDDPFGTEGGFFADAEKRIIVSRHGYKTWSQALFAKFFPPWDLPYNRKNLEKLPTGVRVISTTGSGVSGLARRSLDTGLGEDYPMDMEALAGIRGTFFTSLQKQSLDRVDVRFGARVERPIQLGVRLRPDFDGALDPRRLLMGTVVRGRKEWVYGSRLFFQKTLDPSDEAEVDTALDVFRSSVDLKGLTLGASAINFFAFLPKFDGWLIDRFLAGKTPDIDWQRRIQSQYLLKEDYAKMGLRVASWRSNKQISFDDWQIFDLENEMETSGRSGSFSYNRTMRFFSFIKKRRLQAFSLESAFAGTDYEDEHYFQITEVNNRSRMGRQSYFETTRDIHDMFSPSVAVNGAGGLIPTEKPYKNAEVAYRMIISSEGLQDLSDHLVSKGMSHDCELRDWLRWRWVLRYRLRKSRDDKEKRAYWLSRLLFAVAKRRGPMADILSHMHPEHYSLSYRERVGGRQIHFGQAGPTGLPDEIYDVKHLWEELGAFENIFLDRNVPDLDR